MTTHVLAGLRHGWLVAGQGGPTGLAHLGRDLSIRPLLVPRSTVAPRSGDVAVLLGGRVVVYRPADGLLHRVSAPRLRWASAASMTSAGALVVVGRSGGTTRWARLDHGRWTGGRLGEAATGVTGVTLDADGDHLVAMLAGRAAGDGVDSSPVAGAAASDDGGRTWRQVALPGGLVEVLGVTHTGDGTAFVVTADRLLRIRPGADATPILGIRPFAIAAHGQRLDALVAAGRRPQVRLLTSTDRGDTWRPAELPGAVAP